MYQNCILNVQRHFDRKQVFEKKPIQLLTMIGDFENFPGKLFWPALKSTFYVSVRSFAKNIISLKKTFPQSLCGIWKGKNRPLRETFNRVIKPALYISRKIILKRVYKFGISKLFYLWIFWVENFQPVREISIAGVKTALYVFRGIIWGNLFLEEKNLSYFGPYLENLDFMRKIFLQDW